MKLFLLTFILFITSCGKADRWPANLTFDKSVSEELSNIVLKHTLDLNNQLEREAFVINSPKNRYPITIKYSKTNSDKGYAGLALVYMDRCEIIIYPVTVQYDLVKSVLWHEYGHCIGMNHSIFKDQIMSPSVAQFERYSKQNVELFLDVFRIFLDVVSQ